jgi:hypothetical protein
MKKLLTIICLLFCFGCNNQVQFGLNTNTIKENVPCLIPGYVEFEIISKNDFKTKKYFYKEILEKAFYSIEELKLKEKDFHTYVTVQTTIEYNKESEYLFGFYSENNNIGIYLNKDKYKIIKGIIKDTLHNNISFNELNMTLFIDNINDKTFTFRTLPNYINQEVELRISDIELIKGKSISIKLSNISLDFLYEQEFFPIINNYSFK